ncbi:hypothetical protein [Sphingobium yanoikuyae]|uniref:hypothetical protein n=1 Tax=Sphingobium yanoikuyae TaxID=13690 RepID=UPI0019177FD6|nr:hypothetical protein [Sphingobium yanoikuyae]
MLDMLMEETMKIFKNENIAIDFHDAGCNARKLIYTFTPFQFNDLDGEGFGIPFLVKNGFDVIAIKINDDSWYQYIDDEILSKTSAYSEKYDDVITYGSSMGAYAAILFSGNLKADKIIAISPQFSIKDDFDIRWKKEALAVRWSREITPQCLSEKGDYYIIYDNYFHLDMLQVERIAAVIPPASFHPIRVPFSGHPSGHLMLDMKCLSSTILNIIGQEDFAAANIDIPVKFLINNRKALLNLARQSNDIGRTELSHIAYRRLVRSYSDNEKMMGEYVTFLERQGMLKLALRYMNRMISLNGANPYLLSKAADISLRMRKYRQAMDYCERAVAIDPENRKFANQKHEVLKRI